MIEEPPTTTQRSAEVERRRAGELARPLTRPAGPIAVYDTVTDGMTGWQFLRTGRWLAYTAAAILFAIICLFLANWQFDRGQQASADNAVVAANFSAEPVPIELALPTLGSYDASQNWQRVSVTGVYLANEELVVRNRSNSGTNGFEVVTPLQLSDGSVFLVDRGWVQPSPTDALNPDSIPRPTSGTVSVVVQLRPSEAPLGTGSTTGNQIQSITLPRIQQTTGGDLYTGAYGLLNSQAPAAEAGLTNTQTSMPVEDVGTHISYMVQWLFFALLGFFALGLAARKVHRELNSDDPEERERASARMRKRARKPFTDEELEDEEIDGFLPLTRWGLSSGTGTGSVAGKTVGPTAAPRVVSPAAPRMALKQDDDAGDREQGD
ncbi:SURF1 family cytochrome oxidase biogenesis protein [Subtercola endophyticus]|uniref:SURF1 family cytochrome oxidase biogenesis protein n=1 Tax=Subtercola endophyticus TaxID=2895559 RepID=UPI001E5D9E2A|nr:SURF1 family protein [Subtercola endophyticus]UFS60185.1 SURF1 family protein [Subtercola endophyticus]